MFCDNAEGKCLAPYVVYKTEHMWTTWTEGGPEHVRYNRTKSGWFDSMTFEDWFEFSFLTEVKQENGPVVLIVMILNLMILFKLLFYLFV